jgi:hypothetical protein
MYKYSFIKNAKKLRKGIDKCVILWYNIDVIKRGVTQRPRSTKRKKEVNTMMYIRSTYTGMVMKTDFLPKFGGWEVVDEATYLEWCKANNIEP